MDYQSTNLGYKHRPSRFFHSLLHPVLFLFCLHALSSGHRFYMSAAASTRSTNRCVICMHWALVMVCIPFILSLSLSLFYCYGIRTYNFSPFLPDDQYPVAIQLLQIWSNKYIREHRWEETSIYPRMWVAEMVDETTMTAAASVYIVCKWNYQMFMYIVEREIVWSAVYSIPRSIYIYILRIRWWNNKFYNTKNRSYRRNCECTKV